MTGAAAGSRQPAVLAPVLALLVAFGVAWAPSLFSVVQVTATREDYGFAPFAAVVALMLLVRGARVTSGGCAWVGAGLFLASLGVLVLGRVGATVFLEGLAIILSLLAVIAFWRGRAALAGATPGALCLALCVPLPQILYSEIPTRLRALVTWATTGALDLLGTAPIREGNVIRLPEGELEILTACSGMRSLAAVCVLTLVFAFLERRRLWHRCLLIAAGVVGVVLANILRLVSLGLLVSRGMGEHIEELHEVASLTNVVLALALVFAVDRLLSARNRRRSDREGVPNPDLRGPSQSLATLRFLSLLLPLLGGLVLVTILQLLPPPAVTPAPVVDLAQLPAVGGAPLVASDEIDSLLEALGYDDTTYAVARAEALVARVAVLSHHQADPDCDVFSHPPIGCYRATGWRVLAVETVAVPAGEVRVLTMVHGRTREKRRAYVAYETPRGLLPTPSRAAKDSFRALLAGEPAWMRVWIVEWVAATSPAAVPLFPVFPRGAEF